HNTISGGVFFSAVIQGRDITVNLPAQVTRALSGLPAASAAFTGRRSDLNTLLSALAPRPAGPTDAGTEKADTGIAGTGNAAARREPAVVVTAVGGMGGVGKTELAVQAARTALERGWFPGGVLFTDMFGYDPTRRLGPGRA